MSSFWEIVVVIRERKSQKRMEDRVMVRCASLFSQLVGLFSRGQFHHLVKKHRAERYSKGVGSWDHFVAMLFCQLAQAKSLREICGGLACTTGKLRHPALSYAKAHRPWQMFQDLFYATLDLCKATAPRKRRFRFKNKLLSLDSTADWRQPDFPEHDLNSLTY